MSGLGIIDGGEGEWSALTEPWPQDGTPALAAPRTRLSRQGARLVFSVEAPEPLRPAEDFPGSGFIEGLWETDCGELFLANPETGRYLEINLGAGGAWWACLFSGPRQREAVLDPAAQMSLSVRTTTLRWQGKWLGVWNASAPTLERLLGCPVTAFTGNATAIVRTAEGASRYFTAAPLPPERIDFHQPDRWPALTS